MTNDDTNFSSTESTADLEITSSTLISQLEPIERSRNTILLNRDMLAEFVENPLLKPCQDLWDKGILTMASSANKKDLGSYAYLILDWDSLSEENRKIAKACATKFVLPQESEIYIFQKPVNERVVWVDPRPHYDKRGAITIAIPVNESTNVSEIERGVVEVTDKFKKQNANWVKGFSIDDLRKWYGMDDTDICNPEDFVESGYYYDEESQLFFLSEDLFKLKDGKKNKTIKDKKPVLEDM